MAFCAEQTTIVDHNGAPAIDIDDTITAPMAYTGYQSNFNEWLNDQKHIKELASAGIHIYFLKVHLPAPPKLLSYRYKPTWQEQVDYGIEKIISADPQANIIIRVHLVPDKEFSEKYPSEVMAFDDGMTGPYKNQDKTLEYPGMARYSFASLVWEKKATEDLLGLVKHIEARADGNRVIGYFLLAGTCGEWTFWGDFDHETKMFDYSPAMLEQFKKWVTGHYDSNIEKLRTAWHEEIPGFENISIPGRKERSDYSLYNFRSPSRNQKTIDYISCLNDVMIDRAISFGSAIKKASSRKIITGCFWGYVTGGDPIFGKHLYSRMLNTSAIDFWAAPPHYMNRGLGNHALLHSCVASMKLHNKIWFNESDIRTHLASEWQRKNVDGPDSSSGSCEILKREFGHIICNSVYGFWFEMENGWFKDPSIIKLFQQIQKIGKLSMTLPRKSNSEIAVFIDDKSSIYTDAQVRETILREQRISELCRIGAMPDYYFLSDIDKIPTGQYKLLIFLNAFALDNPIRNSIDALKKGGSSFVWLYAPGIINMENHEKLFDISDMEKLTGFHYEFMTGKKLSTTTEIIDDKYLADIVKGYVFGKELRDIESGICGGPKRNRPVPDVEIRFHIEDPASIPLGNYKDSNHIAFAAKEFGTWRSFFIGSIYPSAAVWRAIAQKAGVHLYSDNPEDIIYHNESFLCIHTKNPGLRSIKLPRKINVSDIFEEQSVGKNIDSFKIEIPAYSTKLFYTGVQE